MALAYDGFNALEMDKMGPMMAVLSAFGVVYALLGNGDKRDPDSWKPRGLGEVLLRNATSTRHDYEDMA